VRTTINNFRVSVPLDSLEQRVKCSFCDSTTYRVVGKVKNDITIQLLECDNCSLVSTNYVPSTSFLQKYYTEMFPEFVEKYNSKHQALVTFSNPNRFASRLVTLLPVDFCQRANMKILDFGGGDGSLALAFSSFLNQSTQVEITVINFGVALVELSSPNVKIKKLQSIPTLEKFDLIIASASLEMLPTFGETLKSLLNVLADEKSNMYVRTNYIQPIRRLIPFLDVAFPAHLHDIGAEFWYKFANLERNRYKVIRTETPISELDFRGFPLRWLIVTLLKLPSRLESRLFPFKLKRYWKFVGSWEVVVSLRC
jgi:hypothetical protein